MKPDPDQSSPETNPRKSPDRRDFLIQSSAAAVTAATVATASSSGHAASMLDAVQQPLIDSPFLGHQWQTLNPGYWCIKNGTLRRRIGNYGDRARRTGFPFHGMTHGFDYQTDYDPSLPPGIAWRPEQTLETSFTVEAEFTFQAARVSPAEGDDSKWKMYSDGFGLMGVAIGGNHLFESFHLIRNALLVGWTDDKKLSLIFPPDKKGYVRQRNQLESTSLSLANPLLISPRVSAAN